MQTSKELNLFPRAQALPSDVLSRIWAAVWRILVFFIGWAGLTAGLVVPVVSRYGARGAALPLWVRLYVETVSAATILLAAWAMLRFIDRRPFVSIGFHPRHLVKDSIVGLLIGLGMMTTCVLLLWMGGWASWSVTGTFATRALAIGTLAMLLNTVTQEVLVRGYVQQTIAARFGTLAGVIGSALFFLALHAGVLHGNALPAISLLAAGVLLGTAYALSGNLWLPIALHFGWNVLQGPVLGQPVSGQTLDVGSHLLRIAGPELVTGGKFGIEGGLVAITITALGTPLLLALYRKR